MDPICASYETLDRDDWNQPGSKSLGYRLRPGHTPHEGGPQRHYPLGVLLILLEDGLVVQGRGGEWQWQESLPHRVEVALQGGGWGGAESLIKDLFRATESQNAEHPWTVYEVYSFMCWVNCAADKKIN